MRLTCVTGGHSIYVSPSADMQDAHTAMDAAGCGHHAEPLEGGTHAGMYASACPRTHPGPCWNPGPGPGRVPDRPAGCAVTRPLLIEPAGDIGLPYGTMTDQNRVNAVMQCFFSSSTTVTVTPGTSGGSAFSMTPPMYLLLMTATGTNTSNGTQLASGSGYTTGGATMGTSAFGAPSAAVQTSNNAVSWSVTGAWSTVVGIEIWDHAGTPLRWLFGALTSNITGANNGDTVQFASGSISISGASW